jgi:hypothetical protein
MTGYTVHYSEARQLRHRIGGAFKTLAQAEAAARKAGAIGNGERSGSNLVYRVTAMFGNFGLWGIRK